MAYVPTYTPATIAPRMLDLARRYNRVGAIWDRLEAAITATRGAYPIPDFMPRATIRAYHDQCAAQERAEAIMYRLADAADTLGADEDLSVIAHDIELASR